MNTNSSFDICERKHKGNACSVQSNLNVNKTTDRSLILHLISTARDGVTLDELSNYMDRWPNAISGRLTELAKAGLIVRTDEKRKTRSGSPAFVWRVAQ